MGITIESTFSWWESQGPLPPADMLGPRAARRATFLARSAAMAIERVGGFDEGTSVVFGSCLGNIVVTMELLEQIASGDDDLLSPIRFMNSVHHAPASHASIASGHTGFMTAVAAADDLCALALMESMAVCADRKTDVILVLCEERWPEAFGDQSSGTESFEPYAGAIRLTYSDSSSTGLGLTRTSVDYDPAGLPEVIRGNPAARLEHVVAWHAQGGGTPALIAPTTDGAWQLSRTQQ